MAEHSSGAKGAPELAHLEQDRSRRWPGWLKYHLCPLGAPFSPFRERNSVWRFALGLGSGLMSKENRASTWSL